MDFNYNLNFSNITKLSLFILISLSLLFIFLSTPADKTFYETERAIFPLTNGDQAKELGYTAIYLLILGLIYIVSKRSYIFIKKYVDKKKHPVFIENSKKAYMTTRKPFFYIHLTTNVSATMIGLIHGLSVEAEKFMMVLTGFLSFFLMAILSTSGLIIWKKFSPFWTNREFKKIISLVHRQWLFSIFLLLFLYLHLFVFRYV